MSAIRVIESSGSAKAVQLSDGSGGFTTTNKIIVNSNQVLLLSGGAPVSNNETGFADVNFFVSGSKNSKSTVVRGTALFGGDLVVSGTLYAEKQVIEVDEYATGSLHISGSLFVKNDIFVTGSLYGNSSIGDPEDGSYADGLFSDFTKITPVGTAVDRFNEVLKALAPAPAPDLDNLNSIKTGTAVLLSFGASNNQSSASPAYISVGSSAGLGSAVDVNGSYTVTTSSNNIRLAAFKLNTHISGVLNSDVTTNSQGNSVQNYPAHSFGDGDTGVLRLEVNGSTIKEIDLTSALIGSGTSGLGSGSYKDSNGSGFNFFSTATTGTFSNGNSFNSFKNRTGQYVVAYESQRNGWNYARVQHVKSGSTATTNYIEWVNDNNNDALAASGGGITFEGSGSIRLSGIEYYRSGAARYTVNVDNAYKYVYSSDPITFNPATSGTESSVGFVMPAMIIPSIDTGAGETQTKQIQIVTSSNVTVGSPGYFLNGTVSTSVTVPHPLKADLTNGGSVSTAQIICYNSPDTSTATSETFRGESYRIVSGTYTAQGDIAGGTWDSSIHMTGSNTNYLNGLQLYRQRLYASKNTVNSGDFSNLTNGPEENPDYSSQSGLRTFYRKFQNTGGSVRDLSYAMAGVGAIEDAGTSVGSNSKFRLFFKLPSNGSNNSGWMDAAAAFSYNATADNDGCYIGSFDDNLSGGATNYVTWGTGSIDTNDYILTRIEADANWTGYVNSLSITFGAVGNVAPAPNVDNVDVDTSGTAAKLSFGSSLSKAPYVNVGTTAGNSAVDANGTYQVTGNRYGVYGPTVTSRVGTINETTTSPGNAYPADAFGGGNGNLGTLKLEVNGSVVHSTDLSSFGSGNSLNGAGSGFNLTAATPGEDSSSLPDYTRFYRTGTYTIVSSSQGDGWNYARVVHSVTGSDYESTYVEWVNDVANPTVALNGVTIGSFGSSTTNSLSGVRYFISPSGSFRMRASNLYKYVYSTNSNALRFPTTTNSTITSITGSGTGVSTTKTAGTTAYLPSLNTGVGSAYDYDLHVTGTFSFDQASSLPGETAYTATVSGRVHHPLQGNTTTSSTQSNKVLVYTVNDDSTITSESFNGEAKRLPSAAYGTQASVSSATYDSTVSLDGGNAAYNEGLIVYGGKLLSPQEAGLTSDKGDFRDVAEGGPLESPASNPDYSSLSNATREYIRWLQNSNVASKSNFALTVTGTGTIVDSTTGLSGNNFRIFMKIPTTDAGMATGWMDLAAPFQTGQYSDDDGCLDGSLTNNISGGAENNGTFGVKSVDQNEYIVIKIVADKTWSGNITDISLSWS